MKPIQQQCADAIAHKAKPGEIPHVSVRTEVSEDGTSFRIAEAFTSRNHSPNCQPGTAAERARKNLVSVRVPFLSGETRNHRDDLVSNEGLATEEAFSQLLTQIQAPPPPAARPELLEAPAPPAVNLDCVGIEPSNEEIFEKIVLAIADAPPAGVEPEADKEPEPEAPIAPEPEAVPPEAADAVLIEDPKPEDVGLAVAQ